MPWVRFLDTFDWRVPGKAGRVSIKYKPGRRLVTTPCATEAIAKGKAQRCASPRCEPDDGDRIRGHEPTLLIVDELPAVVGERLKDAEG